MFGRPSGVRTSFAPRDAELTPSPTAPPPPSALVSAFGKPPGWDGESLQRPPSRQATPGADDGGDGSAALWPVPEGAESWRDPDTPVALGPPALPSGDGTSSTPQPPGPRLNLAEVLFGKRIETRALVVLGLLALLIGAVGGVVGRLTAEGAGRVTEPRATLTATSPARERPPGSVADIAARTLPAVVSLEVRVGAEGGTGSGVVIDPAGFVLTNNHVVAPAAQVSGATIEAVFHDGTRVPATIVGQDPKTDLAVLRVNVANPVVARIGSSSALAVGDSVIAIGSPLGLAGTVTTGIVSALNRPVRLDHAGGDNAVIDAIQTDAAINPGNSGGPLVDATGAVVGINTAIRSLGSGFGEGGSIGLGFAVPIDDARVVAEELIRTGRYQHAALGVNARSVTDGATDGAQVQNVQQGGPAAVAGITEGDVIVRVGERSIASADELVVAVREHRPGDTVEIHLVREGRPLVVSAVLGTE